ncbi:pyridoxal 5'-phosphate synthase, glutaminase subunit Pdx2 [Fibrobacter succinogenes subsp. succinogenes S85]|uniref:Pyridoxal 5'-phosphate synthase subunit PdxT n=1 Tax=Fibrobacter succinogenes (strain ATCC 19169 / S85) TaxID=59374 RepID=C9RKF4_FIBSS|nr:pyridoxal 5'-phosphate synthase glutaminase subunit PdxT [Fibrobacter succinogenes]ACX73882.1 SNO glutamine amidotransferase [Fibrobacter succinogenes subsp. succinogenes S85]ADL27284.1 pyridoxal 5'-phosphate synthase, glutaminase subunit Pdx2 [Fibrobacter succinogenes subsp. succinogenes S85]
MSENKTNNHIKIGVLAVQGAFAEHRQILEKLGVETFEIRQLRDLEQDFDGLILPGGESTVQGKLLHDLRLFEPLRERIESGLPTFGTCAGLILLAEKLSNDGHTYFATTPVTVERNAYGRQLGSFYTEENFEGIGKIPMTFIRAPLIQRASQDVQILATVQNQIVAVRYKNQLAISFHPELNNDLRVHQYFVEEIVKANQIQAKKAA